MEFLSYLNYFISFLCYLNYCSFLLSTYVIRLVHYLEIFVKKLSY